MFLKTLVRTKQSLPVALSFFLSLSLYLSLSISLSLYLSLSLYVFMSNCHIFELSITAGGWDAVILTILPLPQGRTQLPLRWLGWAYFDYEVFISPNNPNLRVIREANVN
jgi:hypothetical protein